jgi:hypothetical protein
VSHRKMADFVSCHQTVPDPAKRSSNLRASLTIIARTPAFTATTCAPIIPVTPGGDAGGESSLAGRIRGRAPGRNAVHLPHNAWVDGVCRRRGQRLRVSYPDRAGHRLCNYMKNKMVNVPLAGRHVFPAALQIFATSTIRLWPPNLKLSQPAAGSE